jgi:predicted phosphoribosyltransferase
MAGPAFRGRRAAGRALAALLTTYRADPDVVVLGLARGGVVVAQEVAEALQVPLDVFVVRKLGAPSHAELAVGAVASGGVVVLNEDVIRMLEVSSEELRRIAAVEVTELHRRETAYRGGRQPEPLRDRVTILVDDGLATGASMRAAVTAVRQQGARRVVVALPTAPASAESDLGAGVDEFICVVSPWPFVAVSRSYRHFEQTSDEEVVAILSR